MDDLYNSPQKPPINIPTDSVSKEALNNLIESFILREGTDYGVIEIEHEKKVLKIMKQLEAGRIKIVFDPNSESVTLMTDQDWSRNKN